MNALSRRRALIWVLFACVAGLLLFGGTASAAAIRWSLKAGIDPFIQQGPKLVPGDGQVGTGVALSRDGNTALIGGHGANNGNGAAWVFVRSGSTWRRQGPELVGTGAKPPAEQGSAVALSANGNTALIGGLQDNYGHGAAWVFVRSGSTWRQQGPKLVGTGGAPSAEQGFAVALSANGNTALIGGPTMANAGNGAAWVFVRSGSTWRQQGPSLVGRGAVAESKQGSSVALSENGNTALIGGSTDSLYFPDPGAAWVFVRSGSTWRQQGPKLVGTGAVGQSDQGSSVALSGSGNTALIGGQADAQNPQSSASVGATWVFVRSGSTWRQQGPKLVGTVAGGPSNGGGQACLNESPACSNQGSSVALSANGNMALIGGSNILAISDPGASWVFVRSGSTWTQYGPRLVGTGAVTGDAVASQQGSSVALSGSGNTALIGGEGDADYRGAAWVFVRVRSARVRITGLRATPLRRGCVTETGTGEREMTAVTADVTCSPFSLDTRRDHRGRGRAVAHRERRSDDECQRQAPSRSGAQHRERDGCPRPLAHLTSTPRRQPRPDTTQLPDHYPLQR